jgi:hypothetical protein
MGHALGEAIAEEDQIERAPLRSTGASGHEKQEKCQK